MIYHSIRMPKYRPSLIAAGLVIIACFCLLFTPMQLHAHSPTMTIKATAEVVSRSDIEIITVNHLTIDANEAIAGIVHVSPFNRYRAGAMRIIGRPNALANIHFDRYVTLINNLGLGDLLMTLEVIGFSSNNQLAGEPLDVTTRSIRFNQIGEFFIWIGSRVDISEARPGNYTGNITLEFEYL